MVRRRRRPAVRWLRRRWFRRVGGGASFFQRVRTPQALGLPDPKPPELNPSQLEPRAGLVAVPASAVCHMVLSELAELAELAGCSRGQLLLPNVLRVRTSQTVQCLFKGYVLDLGALNETMPLLLLSDHVDCAHAQAGCEHAVVAGGCATALDEPGWCYGFRRRSVFSISCVDVLTDTTKGGDDRPSPAVPLFAMTSSKPSGDEAFQPQQ